MANNNVPMEEEASILTLTDGDGNEIEFEYLDVIEHQGKEYIFLLPTENEDAGIVIMEIEPVSEDDENYLPIEDEETMLTVYGLFKEKYKDVLNFSD